MGNGQREKEEGRERETEGMTEKKNRTGGFDLLFGDELMIGS